MTAQPVLTTWTSPPPTLLVVPFLLHELHVLIRQQYALPGNITAGIQHGSWTMPIEKGKAPSPSFLNSNSQHVLEDLNYSTEDIKHIEDWVKRTRYFLPLCACFT